MLTFAVAVSAAPKQVPVTRDTLPKHIEVDIDPHGCDTDPLSPRYGPVWYATIRARVADIPSGEAAVYVKLFDAKTDRFLLNPANDTSHVENGYVVSGIAFEPAILDLIVFEWLEGFTLYRIRLSDFYDGERCKVTGSIGGLTTRSSRP